jgi:hypothetical protein
VNFSWADLFEHKRDEINLFQKRRCFEMDRLAHEQALARNGKSATANLVNDGAHGQSACFS